MIRNQASNMKARLFFVFLWSTVLCISCSKSSGTGNTGGGGNGGGGGTGGVNCATVPKSFSTNVNPIIQSRCAVTGCHAANSINGPGPLTNYTQIFNARASIRAAVISGAMPQNGTLSTAEKNSITCWIDDGAPNN